MSNPYVKSVRHLDEIDAYIIGNLYEVKSHAVFHALKKLLCAGKRGAKDYEQDLMEAIESIERELQIIGLKDEPEWEGRHPSLRFAVRGEQGQFVYGKTEPKDGAAFWVRPEIAEFDEQRIDAIGQNGNDGEHYELSRVTPHGFGCVTEIDLDWKEAVDWSAASPHHKYAFQDKNGRIAFSMYLPGWPNEYIGRPTAQ